MIKKINSFQVLSRQENLTYKFTRDSFSNLPGPKPFVLRKVSRTGKVVEEVKDVEESTAGLILETLLVKKQDVEIEYFSYSKEFQEKLNK